MTRPAVREVFAFLAAVLEARIPVHPAGSVHTTRTPCGAPVVVYACRLPEASVTQAPAGP